MPPIISLLFIPKNTKAHFESRTSRNSILSDVLIISSYPSSIRHNTMNLYPFFGSSCTRVKTVPLQGISTVIAPLKYPFIDFGDRT